MTDEMNVLVACKNPVQDVKRRLRLLALQTNKHAGVVVYEALHAQYPDVFPIPEEWPPKRKSKRKR